MISAFNCPICNANQWHQVDHYHYQQHDLLFNSSSPQHNLSLRRQILFDIWFPHTKEVVLTSLYCDTCGFMCYSPRPTDKDLQAKYEYLSEREKIGALHNPTPRSLRLDRKRELFMYHAVAAHHPASSQKVLDVGGGDGRLIRPFLNHSCQCFVVDFNPNPYPGIQRLGSTLDDIAPEMLFDIIICSHVLEHVSEPGELLRKLRSRLTEKGVLYIEVPLEIWKGIPISKDPVTHLNFFTVQSLENALLLNVLDPLSIEYKIATYGGKYKRVAWTVAAATEITPSVNAIHSSKTTAVLLQPTAWVKMRRRFEEFYIQYILNFPLRIDKKLKALQKSKKSSSKKALSEDSFFIT